MDDRGAPSHVRILANRTFCLSSIAAAPLLVVSVIFHQPAVVPGFAPQFLRALISVNALLWLIIAVTLSTVKPHTVQLYDFGVTDEGTLYYVMELLDGMDLDTLVSRFGPVPPERAIHLLLQVCASLAEAHVIRRRACNVPGREVTHEPDYWC